MLAENRRLSLAHSSSSSAAVRPSVSSRHAAGCGNLAEPSLYFCCSGKRVVLAYVYSFANSDRYRIVGCCNRLGRVRRGRPTSYPLGFPGTHYIMPCTTVRRHTPNQSRFCQSRALRRHRSLLHPERRRAPTFGRAGLRNQSPL